MKIYLKKKILVVLSPHVLPSIKCRLIHHLTLPSGASIRPIQSLQGKCFYASLKILFSLRVVFTKVVVYFNSTVSQSSFVFTLYSGSLCLMPYSTL